MIIRSQDKRKIIPLNQPVYIEKIVDEWKISTERYFIGTYSTEEKAIKVLDMIQEEYGKHLYGQGGQMATVDIYIQPFAFIPPKVFEMPSDEEVEV